MKLRVLGLLVVGSLFIACGQAGGGLDDDYQIDEVPIDQSLVVPAGCLGSLWVPGDFDYQMSRGVTVEITLLQEDGTPRSGTLVSVFDSASEMPGDQNLLVSGRTDVDGRWIGEVLVPTDQTAVNVVASFMGARNSELVLVEDGLASIELGGE